MCYKPINVRQADGRYMKVKCGKCLECLNEKRNAWVIRMEEELKSAHGKGVFFTLTYSDTSIPKNFLVYETCFSDEPKLYESYSDYDYSTPVGFRGKRSVSEPVDKVLQEFYKDYTITEFNIDNNYKKYKAYEQVKDILSTLDSQGGESVSYPLDGFYDMYGDMADTTDIFSTDSGDFDISHDIQNNNDLKSMTYEQFVEQWESPDYEGAAVTEVVQPNEQGAVDTGTPMVAVDSPDDRDTTEGEGNGQIKPYLVIAFNSCRQKDLQDWLKRGREKLRRQGKSFTYFLTSEYGPRTLRPHYHGCFFGVSADEVRFMFEDWQARYGRSDVRKKSYKFDNINSTAGCGYCAKYCAKGFYEHPLCARDFFYRKNSVYTGDNALDTLLNTLEFTEYHSKHYERCMEFFHIDKPIVTPTFRLVSKGLGIDYIARTKDYFRLNEVEENISILKHSNDYDEQFTTTMGELQRYFHYTNSKGFSFTMPQYYSAKMFSDNLRHAFANYVRSQYDRIYYEQFRQLQSAEPTREGTEILSQMEEAERRTKIHRLQGKLEKVQKFFNKSKL